MRCATRSSAAAGRWKAWTLAPRFCNWLTTVWRGVAKAKKGLVAQQEVDDSQGKYLTAQADVEAAKANQEAAQSQAEASRAKRMRDAALFEYTKIPAPFDGVVTQRYANYGTLI